MSKKEEKDKEFSLKTHTGEENKNRKISKVS